MKLIRQIFKVYNDIIVFTFQPRASFFTYLVILSHRLVSITKELRGKKNQKSLVLLQNSMFCMWTFNDKELKLTTVFCYCLYSAQVRLITPVNHFLKYYFTIYFKLHFRECFTKSSNNDNYL